MQMITMMVWQFKTSVINRHKELTQLLSNHTKQCQSFFATVEFDLIALYQAL